MKIRTRITFAALVLAESTLLALLLLQHALEKRNLEHKQLIYQERSLQRLARVALDSSFEQNEVFLLNYFKVLKDSPEIRYAALTDETNLVRLHTAVLDGAPIIGTPWAGPAHQGEGLQKTTVTEDGRELQVWSLPLLKANRQAGAVYLAFDSQTMRKSVLADLADSRRPLLWAGLALSLMAWLGAVRLARGLTAPLLTLHAGAKRLGAGELDFRINMSRADEIGDLGRSFNFMASELARISKFKEQIMASIAHDLRSPLTAVSVHAETLLFDDEATPDERRESAELIYENVKRMSAMSNDLTDLVKLQMGRLEVSRQPVHLEESFETVRRLMDAVAKRLDVKLEVETGLSLPLVFVDPVHLQRVLTNLVSNALKFTPTGGRIILTAQAEEKHVKVMVCDNGTGIPEAKLKGLFTRFTGTEGVKHGNPELGTGLGLSICRELIEQNGGKIWAESEWKKGTRVFFTLPRGI